MKNLAYWIAVVLVATAAMTSMASCGSPQATPDPYSNPAECLRDEECVKTRTDWSQAAELPCSLAIEDYVTVWGDFTPIWIADAGKRFNLVLFTPGRDYDSVHYLGSEMVVLNPFGELLYQSYDCYYDPVSRNVLEAKSVFVGMARLEETDELLARYAPHLR